MKELDREGLQRYSVRRRAGRHQSADRTEST